MKIIKRETIFNGKYLKFKRNYFITKKGKKGLWEFTERKSFGPPVVIFALTKEREVILEKSYRAPFEDFVLELPAGLQDKKGEKEENVAKRELLEETGYRVKKVIPVLKGPVSPGESTGEISVYFAKDAVFAKDPSTEDTEEIEVLKVPLKKLVGFLEEESKKMKVDVKILSILPILQKRKLI